ncbi:MAG: glycoside hydrolase family 1 protein [Candidatus Nanohaloarchaea archaeon]
MKFLWGVSTSAHQTEGDEKNDWTRWESKNHNRKALYNRFTGRIKRGKENWKNFKDKIKDPENYISRKKAYSYKYYKKDIELANDIGVNSYRFSTEWSRIQEAKNSFNQKQIEHYKKIIDLLDQRNIEPFVTLWHFTNPQWFVDEYGWSHPESVEIFTNYVEKMVDELESVNYWITFNEARGWLVQSYLMQNWPPANNKRRNIKKAYNNILEAHKKSYEIIKNSKGNNKVSTSVNIGYIEPYTENIINKKICELFKYLEHKKVLEDTNNYRDFISLNHYAHLKVDFLLRNIFNEDQRIRSDLNWPQSSKSIHQVLKQLYSDYNQPIIITEHGIADKNDNKRRKYLRKSLKNVEKALNEDIDVRGYHHWSLIDNFEWDKGKWPRFGLINLNYENYERTMRKSGKIYKKFIEKNKESFDQKLENLNK